MPDYIPHGDSARLRWLFNALEWLQANGAAFGFKPAEIEAFAAVAREAGEAIAQNEVQQAAAREATAAKNDALKKAIRLGRNAAQRVQHARNTTDDDRAAMGISLSASGATPPINLETIPPPKLLAIYNGGEEVVIHWGTNPANERRNPRPPGTRACAVQTARGGIPADDSGWVSLDWEAKSPVIHSIQASGPLTIAYRACYILKNLKQGPYSEPILIALAGETRQQQ